MLIEATHYHPDNGNQASWLSCKDLDQGNSGSGTRGSGDILLVLCVNIATRGNSLVQKEEMTYPLPPGQAHCWTLCRHHHHKTQDCRKANQQSPRMHRGNGEKSGTREGTVAKETYAKSEPTITVALYIPLGIHQCH